MMGRGKPPNTLRAKGVEEEEEEEKEEVKSTSEFLFILQQHGPPKHWYSATSTASQPRRPQLELSLP
jgi:hypothetical protein